MKTLLKNLLMTFVLVACGTQVVQTNTPIPMATAKPVDAAHSSLSIILGVTNNSQGITLDENEDADTEIVQLCQSPELRQTGNGRPLPADPTNAIDDYYMQFKLDNEALFNGQPTNSIRLDIEYCDQGTDNFSVQYDGISGGPFGNGTFVETNPWQKSNTQRILTASFELKDVNFGDRDNGADFRIADMGDGAEAIFGITITLLDATATAEIATPREVADIIFYNGDVLTMEVGLPVKQAIAIAGDHILQVGNDAEVLAWGGPETKLVDLQGRALMPGFVDAHTHILNDAEGYYGISLLEAQQMAFRNGITTIGDPYITPDFLGEIQALDAAGQLQLRTSLYLIYTDNCGNLTGDWWKEHPPTHNFGEMLRINGIKIFLDGGTCDLPATSVEYYAGQGVGKLFLSQQQLNAAVAEAQRLNYQVVMHIFGDRATEEALNAIEATLQGEPNYLRHRIDHNVIIPPNQLPRYGQIGVVTVIFGYFPVCTYTATDPFLQQNEWPWRDLLDANPGLHVAWHGDDPWLPPMYPILDLYNMVTRRGINSDGSICEPPAWIFKQRITVGEALPMMTTGAAYALFRETEVGSLKPGKLADLIILSANPLAIDPNEIKDIKLWMTMVGGQTVYCDPSHESYCP